MGAASHHRHTYINNICDLMEPNYKKYNKKDIWELTFQAAYSLSNSVLKQQSKPCRCLELLKGILLWMMKRTFVCCSAFMYVHIWSIVSKFGHHIWRKILNACRRCKEGLQNKLKDSRMNLILLHTSSLVKRRLKGALIQAYRIMKGIDKVDIKHFFKLFELDDGGAWWIW